MNKILVHKNDVNYKCYDSKDEKKDHDNLNFAIKTLKNKHSITNSVDYEVGYETVLSIKPYIRFRNLIPRCLKISFKGKFNQT